MSFKRTGADSNDEKGLIAAGVLAVIVAAAELFALRARQGSVIVEVDEHGIRERDGAHVRIDIPWDRARSFVRRATIRASTGATYQATTVLFVSSNGEVIRLTNHDARGLFSRRDPFRVYVAGHSLEPFVELASACSALPVAPEDPRTHRRNGGTVTDIAVWLGGLGMYGLPLLWSQKGFKDLPLDEITQRAEIPLPRLVLFSALFFVAALLRTSRVLGEARRTRDLAASPTTTVGVLPRFGPEIAVRLLWLLALTSLPWISSLRLALR